MAMPSVRMTKPECVIGKPGSARPSVVAPRVKAKPIGAPIEAPIEAPAACSSSTTPPNASGSSDDKGLITKRNKAHKGKGPLNDEGSNTRKSKGHKGRGPLDNEGQNTQKNKGHHGKGSSESKHLNANIRKGQKVKEVLDNKGTDTRIRKVHKGNALKEANGSSRAKDRSRKGKTAVKESTEADSPSSGEDHDGKGDSEEGTGDKEDWDIWNKVSSANVGSRPATARPTSTAPHVADVTQADNEWDKFNVFNVDSNKRQPAEQLCPPQRLRNANVSGPRTTASQSASRTNPCGPRGDSQRDERGNRVERVHTEGTSGDRHPERRGERRNDGLLSGRHDGIDARGGEGKVFYSSRDFRSGQQTAQQPNGHLSGTRRDGNERDGTRTRSRSLMRHSGRLNESRGPSPLEEGDSNVVSNRKIHLNSYATSRGERGQDADEAGARENRKRLKSGASADPRIVGDKGQPGGNVRTFDSRLARNSDNAKKSDGYEKKDNADERHDGGKGQSRTGCVDSACNITDRDKRSNSSAVKRQEKTDVRGNNNDEARPSVPDWRARYTVQQHPTEPKKLENKDAQRPPPQNRRSRSRSKHHRNRGEQRHRSPRRRSLSRRKHRRSRERSPRGRSDRGGSTRELSTRERSTRERSARKRSPRRGESACQLPRVRSVEDAARMSIADLKREERQRKLAAVLAMGVDPATAEMAVDDPRFDITMYQQGAAAAAGQQTPGEVYDVKVVKIEEDDKEAYKAVLLHKKGSSQVDIDGPERLARDEALADSQNLQASYETGGEAAARETVTRLRQIVWTSNDLLQALSNDRLRKINYVMLCGVATEEEATAIVDDTPDFDLEAWVTARYKAANAVKMPEPGGNVIRQGSRWWVASFTCYEASEDGVSFKTHKVYAPKQEDGSKANLDLAAFREAFERGGYEALLEEEKRLAHHVWTKEALDEHYGPEDTKDPAVDQTELPELPSRVVEDEEMPITLSGHHDFLPMATWEDGVFHDFLSQDIVDILIEKGLPTPTPIQQHTASIIAAGCDLLAAAQTGSGKTVAFLAPILKKLTQVPRPHIEGAAAFASPLAVFLSPTRELTQQTHKWVDMLSPFKTLCLFGGEPLQQQLAIISQQQIDCICATPGRLLDALDCNRVSLAAVQAVVVDEADHMLGASGGLDTTVTSLLSGRDMPENRQTILFSATFPSGFEKACRRMLRADNHCVVHVGDYGESAGGSTDRIVQHFVKAGRTERWKYIIRDLNQYWTSGKAILFANRIADAQPLIRLMWDNDIKADHLHGKLRQQEREDVVERFTQGDFDLLVCTNLGARGLDFPDIDLVVQLELPPSLEVYTHRIGRTGRQGRHGCALSYFGPRDTPLARPLCDFLSSLHQEIPEWLSELGQNSKRHEGKGGD